MKISVTILTKNSQDHIEEILSALHCFDEVVVYDTGSTDSTMDIARNFSNVTLFEREFIGFGPTHNLATKSAKNDWILSIDSDEVPTKELLDELKKLSLDSRTVYSFPRHNYFNGKFIRWCGWHPESVTRLYNRKQTRFSDHQVHEGVITDSMHLAPLKGVLKHYSYDSINEFLSKMQLYSELFAKQNAGKKSSSVFKALSHGFFAFFKCYFLKRGFMGGYEGFVISLYNAHTAYYKYLKLHEYNQKLSGAQKKRPA